MGDQCGQLAGLRILRGDEPTSLNRRKILSVEFFKKLIHFRGKVHAVNGAYFRKGGTAHDEAAAARSGIADHLLHNRVVPPIVLALANRRIESIRTSRSAAMAS
jgi:hypothetical protein